MEKCFRNLFFLLPTSTLFPINKNKNNHFCYAYHVPFTGNPTNLTREAFPLFFWSGHWGSKRLKKVAPSRTIAEQGTSSYPRSVWFQDLHFIFCQITKLFIQRRLARSQGQQCASPTRKSPFLGPFLVQDLIISLERISLSLSSLSCQLLGGREDPCS